MDMIYSPESSLNDNRNTKFALRTRMECVHMQVNSSKLRL